MQTMTEEEIVSKWGPIRFYEIIIYKSIPLSASPYANQCRRSGLATDWQHSQTIRCYSKDEMETTLAKLKVKAPTMTTKKLLRKILPVDQVRISVWTRVRGRGAGIRPVFSEIFKVG